MLGKGPALSLLSDDVIEKLSGNVRSKNTPDIQLTNLVQIIRVEHLESPRCMYKTVLPIVIRLSRGRSDR